MVWRFNVSTANTKTLSQWLKLWLSIWEGHWINPRWILVKRFRSYELWVFNTILGPTQIKLRMIFLKALTQVELRREWSNLSHLFIAEIKKGF